MMRNSAATLACVTLLAVVCAWTVSSGCGGRGVGSSGPASAGSEADCSPEKLSIIYPPDEALFPPEIAAPTFRWEDDKSEAERWQVTIEFQGESASVCSWCDVAEWTPSDLQWEEIKGLTCEKPALVKVCGYRQKDETRIVSAGIVSICTSEDEVGAPLFFREVNLPFLTAVKDPALHIRWRFGEISSKDPPPIVLDKLPVCGNCHSFSADGETLAMEVDSGNDKGAYAILPIEEEMPVDEEKIISWADYHQEDDNKTFGLLCQISPDGRYVMGTVKDRALAIYRPELAFSQLFFLVKGILATYDRETGDFSSLPGADDPRYVQTNATWSPDGKTLVFAKSCSEIYDPPGLSEVGGVLVPERFARVFANGEREFKYDLYRIPFNEGKGGKAEPILGASDNGMSNYFPKFSPDGKWIVFCKAKSFMLLQPDSELYIIPAEGGEARRLRCNTGRMNSWHSWSPNGKWLVFSSKAHTIYTQLFLTHIDAQGRSSPAVVLANFTEAERAANIPEFVNTTADAIGKIRPEFLDDTNYVRAGDAYRYQGEPEEAIPLYRKALELNPKNAIALTHCGACLLDTGEVDEAMDFVLRAIERAPDFAPAYCALGMIHRQQLQLKKARQAFWEALQLDPDYRLAHLYLGIVANQLGDLEEAETHLAEARRLDPLDPTASYNLALVMARAEKSQEAVDQLVLTLEDNPEFVPALIALAIVRVTNPDEAFRDVEEAVDLATRACELTKDTDPEALRVLAVAQAESGQAEKAVVTAGRASKAARSAGNSRLAELIDQSFEHLKQSSSSR